MKILFIIAGLLVSCSAIAEGKVSSACAKHIVYHRTTIQNAAFEINGRLNIEINDRMTANDELAGDLVDDLIDAVDRLHKRKSITARQAVIVKEVCTVYPIDIDSVGEALSIALAKIENGGLK